MAFFRLRNGNVSRNVAEEKSGIITDICTAQAELFKRRRFNFIYLSRFSSEKKLARRRLFPYIYIFFLHILYIYLSRIIANILVGDWRDKKIAMHVNAKLRERAVKNSQRKTSSSSFERNEMES